MLQKTIHLKGDKQIEFAKVIASRFGITSDSELNVLLTFVNMGLFSPFNMDKNLRDVIKGRLSMKESTFAVCINRLISKECIKKAEKSFYLNPAFSGLNDIDQIVFKVV